jgi:protein TonB
MQDARFRIQTAGRWRDAVIRPFPLSAILFLLIFLFVPGQKADSQTTGKKGEAGEFYPLPVSKMAESKLKLETVPAETLPRFEEIAFQKAVPLEDRNQPPAYPRFARQSGYEGCVLLRLTVDETGAVAGTEILRSSGHRILDRAAVKAVLKWRFRPAEELGVPAASRVEVPVVFKLKN